MEHKYSENPASSLRNQFFLILFLYFISPINIYTQTEQIQFENYSVDQGMPTVVNYILQDKIGYLWFATNSGLYKYDGYSFTSYKHDLNDTNSLVDNSLTTLYEDKEGILWIGTWLGIEKFDRINNTFIHYTPNPSSFSNGKSNNVWTICEDNFGMIWIGTGDGLYKFNKTNEKFISLRYDSLGTNSISDDEFGSIYKDTEGSLWFGTQVGLDRFDFSTGEFIHYWNDPNNRNKSFDIASKHRINTIYGDDSGMLWLGTNGGLVEFNPKLGTFITYLFNPKNSQNRITSICQDAITGSLWMATQEGIFSFDKKLKKFTHYNSEANVIISERSGTIWFGTNSEIKKVNRKKQPFKKYLINYTTNYVANGTEGILWIFTYEEWWKKFDIRKRQFVPYSFGKDFLYYVYPEGDQAFLKEDGSFYISDTLDNIQFFSGPSNKELNTNLTFGWKTNKGYYVGSDGGGLYLFEPKTNHIREIKNFESGIYYIFEDSYGSVWVATYMGKLFCYNQDINTIEEVTSGITNLSNLSRRQISQIYEDNKRRLWFASITGLNKYERATKSFIHLTEKDGLTSNNILGIVEDDHGYLWLNTSKGISKFDPETNHFKNYDASYGLALPTDAYYGIGCKTRNGNIYFPGSKAITQFHPDSVIDNNFIPLIVITSFKKFDKPYPFTDEIHLPYDENFISFEFAALSFISPERNQYAYKMEGLDKDWIYSGQRRYASYPNLDPGEYIFKVKGSNNDGVWNEAGTSISIIISPPWWKTTWAYTFYVIIILIIIYFAWKMQLKRIRMNHEYEMSKFEAEKLHEVDEMKSKFFTNISHEFRTPLTLILGPVKQIIERTKEEKTRDDLKVVHKSANRLLELVNQLLDISKLESGNMKLQTAPQNIIPLLKALVMSFTSYAERKRINLEFNSVEEELIVYIDKDKFEKIITNILSNAFKFTPEGGRVEVAINCQAEPALPSGRLVSASSVQHKIPKRVRDDNFVEISISDTGIGIPEEKIPKVFDRFYQVDGSHTREQEGTGIGLSLTKELIELHKGTIEVHSEEGKGTTFKINIPLGKGHLKPEEICSEDSEKEFKKEVGKIDLVFEEFNNRNETDKIGVDLQEKLELPLLLIVEDNSDVRNYIKNNLYQDYNILEAVDGEDGWNKSVDKIPDLIISDVMMPKMDGFELCEKLKSDERTSHIPVILLTAKAASSDKIEGFETGADDYIMKPFEPNELRARVKNLIEQRKRIHEHIRKIGIIELEQSNITSIDKKFLQKAFAIINQNISDTAFGLETFAELLSISRSVLHRKITSLTGESPGELIRRIRLKKAAQLIEQNFGNISEISLEVGFSNPSQFARSFHKQFGVSPSLYQQKITNK